MDPVAYLLMDLVYMGAKLNDQLQILMYNEPAIDIIATPHQYLYVSVLEAAARARTLAAEGTKKKNSGPYEIDRTAPVASHAKNDGT